MILLTSSSTVYIATEYRGNETNMLNTLKKLIKVIFPMIVSWMQHEKGFVIKISLGNSYKVTNSFVFLSFRQLRVFIIHTTIYS